MALNLKTVAGGRAKASPTRLAVRTFKAINNTPQTASRAAGAEGGDDGGGLVGANDGHRGDDDESGDGVLQVHAKGAVARSRIVLAHDLVWRNRSTSPIRVLTSGCLVAKLPSCHAYSPG